MRERERHGTALARVLELTVLLGEDMRQELGRHGLTPSRMRLLWQLHEQGPSTQRVLAQSLAVSPRNITGLVDALASTGFVTREPHPTDRRATVVRFTDHGARLVAQLHSAREDLAETLFAGIPDDTFTALVDGLDHVLAQLRDVLPQQQELA